MERVGQKFFSRDALVVARELLGKVIKYNGRSGMIVETECYKRDPASHAYKITPRSKIMADTYGHVYVYFTYGMHWCLNFTTNKDDVGAVLIRALEPIEGIKESTSGPARLTKALGVTGRLNGTKIGEFIEVYNYESPNRRDIATSGRVGIKNGQDLPWRFYLKGSPFVSKFTSPS